MRFKIAGAHKKFYFDHGFVEFESLLPSNNLPLLGAAIDQVIAQRLSKKLSFCSPQELFRVGRDVWRQDPLLHKFATSRPLAELAAQLCQKPLLHLAFDQVLRTGLITGSPNAIPLSLEQISSIQPLAGAFLFHLSGSSPPSELIPQQPENGIFLAPNLVIPWELFFQSQEQCYLLIAYASPEALYVLEKRDVHTHSLKSLGYGFGDRLRAPHHPIVYRREL